MLSLAVTESNNLVIVAGIYHFSKASPEFTDNPKSEKVMRIKIYISVYEISIVMHYSV